MRSVSNLFTEFLDELKLYREQREDLLKNIESYKLQCDEAIQSVREDIQTYREQCDGVIQSARDDIQTYRGQWPPLMIMLLTVSPSILKVTL